MQDENSLCLCFKNMYRTLFVAIFTSTFIFSMYDHILVCLDAFSHTYRNINISNQLGILTLNNSEYGLRAFKVAQFYSPIYFSFTISWRTLCFKILFLKAVDYSILTYLLTQSHRINVKLIFCT